MAGVKGHGADLLAHAVGGHHLSGDGAGPLDVVAGAGGDVPQAQLLRRPAPQQRHDLVLHVPSGEVGAVLLRQGDGHAAGLSPGDDADLAHRVVIRQGVHHHGVPRLVVGRQLPLVLGDDPAPLLRSGDDLDLRRFQVLHGDEPLVLSGGQQGRLVDQILQICAGKAGGAPGQLPQVHVLGEGLALGVDL